MTSLRLRSGRRPPGACRLPRGVGERSGVRALAVVIVASAACYESHGRPESAEGDASAERDAAVDAGPFVHPTPRRPHGCVDEPQRIADVPPDWLGIVRVVSRGPDYAVSWSYPGGSAGMAIAMYDGRLILPYSNDVQMVPLADGYLLSWHYSATFWRITSEGEPIAEELLLPEIVPPHWQSLELHGDRLRFVTHSRTDPTPHVFEIDIAAWSARRVAIDVPPEPAHRYAFTADRSLVVHRAEGTWLQGQRTGADGISAVEFDVQTDVWPSDVRFDDAARSWRIAGSVVAPTGERLVASARVSLEGEISEVATLPADAEGTAAAIWAAHGPDVAIAASPIGSAMAVMPIYFGRETRAGVSVVYPAADGTLRGGGVFGVPSSFQPAIAWSEADRGFAIVSVERDASDRTYLALRCGLRP
jgi:hypothetical protein